ncbi:hypothetical protein APY04_0380 [Hyphomicrobium sulfonivorans]|uniref:Uncharacterized protein n=1 Tax=Hyphomicrobium sulfonivorans TaxID=121290 RepID=A0A109BMY0_HYPSL|nr:hypothetical protein [Hyphomicrobium sulfonivorans]KWT71783.1 hypothetical protein APY04_0380 [Hyphomicrobium sulfonivorans]
MQQLVAKAAVEKAALHRLARRGLVPGDASVVVASKVSSAPLSLTTNAGRLLTD